jgi:hypothetical protein
LGRGRPVRPNLVTRTLLCEPRMGRSDPGNPGLSGSPRPLRGLAMTATMQHEPHLGRRVDLRVERRHLGLQPSEMRRQRVTDHAILRPSGVGRCLVLERSPRSAAGAPWRHRTAGRAESDSDRTATGQQNDDAGHLTRAQGTARGLSIAPCRRPRSSRPRPGRSRPQRRYPCPVSSSGRGARRAAAVGPLDLTLFL